MTKPNGGPAFPAEIYYPSSGRPPTEKFIGMSLRDYACIELRMPETDKDWLNELILKSRKPTVTFDPMLKEREK